MNLKKYFTKEFFSKNWIIISILLISTVLHFYQIEAYMIFLGDEGRDAIAVYNILHGHLTLLGPTASVGGFFLGPIYYYISAPFLLLAGFNPIGPSIMVALFGIATVFLIYRLGLQLFDKRTGLIASFLYAISPIVLIYSRSSWNPNLMPFFTIVTLSSLYLALKKQSTKLFVLTGILYGILMQLHYIEIFLSIIFFFYVILFYKFNYKFDVKKIVKNYLSILVGFIIGFAPFLMFEIRHGFTNTLNIINFIFHSNDTGVGEQIVTVISGVFMRLFGGILFNFPLAKEFPKYNNELLTVWTLFILLVSFASIGIFIFRFIKLRGGKRERFNKNLMLLLWLFFGILLFGLYKKPVYDYYLEFLYPVPFLLVGFLLSSLLSKKIYFKALSIGLIAVAVVLSIARSQFWVEPNHQLRQTKIISDFILSKTDNKPFNFALISSGNSDHAYRYFFKLSHRDPVAIQNPQTDPSRSSVTDQLLVFCENLTCSPEGNSLWEVAGFGQAKVAERWRISIGYVYKLVHKNGSKSL